jgi:restriction system protein
LHLIRGLEAYPLASNRGCDLSATFTAFKSWIALGTDSRLDIPDYQACMLPLLKKLADGGEHKFSGIVAELGTDFRLTEEQLSELLPSETQSIFANRVGWARLYLKKAGLLDAPKREFLQITERGRKILSEGHERIDTKFLERFQEFVAFKQRDSAAAAESLSAPSDPSTLSSTPFEMLEDAYGRIRSGLANELLETLQNYLCSGEALEASHRTS